LCIRVKSTLCPFCVLAILLLLAVLKQAYERACVRLCGRVASARAKHRLFFSCSRFLRFSVVISRCLPRFLGAAVAALVHRLCRHLVLRGHHLPLPPSALALRYHPPHSPRLVLPVRQLAAVHHEERYARQGRTQVRAPPRASAAARTSRFGRGAGHGYHLSLAVGRKPTGSGHEAKSAEFWLEAAAAAAGGGRRRGNFGVNVLSSAFSNIFSR
jgi:hypothetical protein